MARTATLKTARPVPAPVRDIDSPLFITALAKGLAVLRSFGPKRRDMALKELAEYNDMTMSSAQRIAYTLEAMELLIKDPKTRRYRLGVRTLEYGSQYLQTEPLIERANSILLDLNQQCGETVNLQVPCDDDIVLVGRVQSRKHIPIYLPIGRRIPAFCTASGRACLATRPDSEVKAFLAKIDKTRYTPSTVVDEKRLLALVVDARRRGYSYAQEEYFIGDLNVAAAVTNESGEAVAAINVSVPSKRWTEARMREELAPLAIRAARALGAS